MGDVIKESRKALKGVHRGQIAWTVHRIAHADRVFCIGNGGGAAHAMHFAADLRKIAHVKAYSFDSIPEMTARCNDQGWEWAWEEWLKSYDADRVTDCLFLFSVGGGNDGLSMNLPDASHGIVGANGKRHDRIVIPSTSTPVIEGCQSVIAHHIVEQLANDRL